MAAAPNPRDTTYDVWKKILDASIAFAAAASETVTTPLFLSDKATLNNRDTQLEIQMKVLAIFNTFTT